MMKTIKRLPGEGAQAQALLVLEPQAFTKQKPPLCKGGWVLRSKTRGDCKIVDLKYYKMIAGQSLSHSKAVTAPFAQGSLFSFGW